MDTQNLIPVLRAAKIKTSIGLHGQIFIKMKKHLVKNGRRIVGFVYSDSDGQFWYAFGRPSQDEYISFACRDLEHGIACIEMYRPIGDNKKPLS